MKRFLYTILLNLVGVAILLYGLQYMVDKGLRKSKMMYYQVWNDIYNGNIHSDVIINGGSRGWMQIDTRILDSVAQTNSYSIGIDGWYFPMQYTRFKILLQHNPKPKFVVQNVDFTLFTDRKDLFISEQFLPYLGDTMLRRITYNYLGRFTTAEYTFPMFKYNNHMNLVKEGLLCYFNTGKRATNKLYKGFASEDLPWNDVFDNLKAHNPNGVYKVIDPEIVRQFDEYLAMCKANGIQVIFVFQPLLREEYVLERNPEETLNLIHQFAQKYNIPFFDYSNDPICYDRKYFIDFQHLNPLGSQMFTPKFAADVKSVLHSK